ncbi:MAG: RsiV family protein [Bacilli bacterium]|nr:RsiV family protein [Bacilli bacterium]
MAKKSSEKKVDNNNSNRSNGNGLIIGFLLGIILMLVTIIVLFATNTISFNRIENEDRINEIKEEDKEAEKEEEKFVITFRDEKKEYKDSKGEVKITNTRNVPVISSSSNQMAADNMVEYMTSISDEQWDALNKNDYTKDDMIEVLPANIGIQYKFSVKAKNDNYITFELMMSGSMGGVGWPGLWGYTFNTTNGKIVSYKDMIIDSSADDYLYNYLIDAIKEYSGEGNLWEGNVTGEKNWKEVVKEVMFSEGHCYLTDKGMKFTFDKYSLGIGALGVPEVEVPFEKINSYLKSEYRK